MKKTGSKNPDLKKLFRHQQRALEAGKTGYKKADALLDALETEMKEGRLKLGKPVDIGNGEAGILKDKFAEKSKVGAGLSVRRYEVEIVRAADIAEQI